MYDCFQNYKQQMALRAFVIIFKKSMFFTCKSNALGKKKLYRMCLDL